MADSLSPRNSLGRHGAKVVVMGRRQAVLDEAVEDLKASGIDAAGVQVKLTED